MADDHARRHLAFSHRPSRRPAVVDLRLEVRLPAAAILARRRHRTGGNGGPVRATCRGVRRVGHRARISAHDSRDRAVGRVRPPGRIAAVVPSRSAHARERSIFHGAQRSADRLHGRYGALRGACRVGPGVRSAGLRMLAAHRHAHSRAPDPGAMRRPRRGCGAEASGADAFLSARRAGRRSARSSARASPDPSRSRAGWYFDFEDE